MRIKLALEKPFKTIQTRGIWIKGEPGIGKSHLLMENYHDQLYEKSQNKWFDGYCNERIILLDDFDHKGADCLGHYLKRWADKWIVKGEVKGNTI